MSFTLSTHISGHTNFPNLSISDSNTNMQVLLLGGHGKIAMHLTPLLLNRAWNVTSMIRNPDHENEILALGKGRKGKLNVLISSLDDVKTVTDAQKILDTVTPDYVVWSAGTLVPLPHFESPFSLLTSMAHNLITTPIYSTFASKK